MDVLKRIPVREQDAKERATNFKEVCLGYNKEEAMEEALKSAGIIVADPVSRGIPSPSVNWSVSLQTGQEKTVSNPHRQHRRTAKR